MAGPMLLAGFIDAPEIGLQSSKILGKFVWKKHNLIALDLQKLCIEIILKEKSGNVSDDTTKSVLVGARKLTEIL